MYPSLICCHASVVLRSSGRAASGRPPPHPDAVGRRLGAAAAGASVPESGEQSELAARHRQPAEAVFHSGGDRRV